MMKNRLFYCAYTAALVWWAAYMSARIFFPKHLAFPFTILDLLTILLIPSLCVLEKLLKVERPQEENGEKIIFYVLFCLPFVVDILQFAGILS